MQTFLFCGRSAYRTDTGASTALDTGVGVNYIFAVALRNRADGALRLTSAAADAFIANYVCHGNSTSYKY